MSPESLARSKAHVDKLCAELSRESNLQVQLVVAADPDPFEAHASLKEVWPEPYASEAALASREDSATGEIFYILLEEDVVGITGIFFDDASPDEVFLRWTGVIPGLRRGGVAREAVRQLAGLCKARYPQGKRLVELVPDNDYGHSTARPFFEKVGFVKIEALVPAGEDADWDVIVYGLDLC